MKCIRELGNYSLDCACGSGKYLFPKTGPHVHLFFPQKEAKDLCTLRSRSVHCLLPQVENIILADIRILRYLYMDKI